MRYSFPDYYKQFQCVADRCEDTCCAGWQIVIDEHSWKRYCRVRGPVGRFVRKELRRKDHTFRQTKDGRCAFLDQNNLCKMYRVLGKNSLCKTCRLYPRHVEEFENVREVTLSLSCPEVAKIIFAKQTPVRFLEFEKEGEETFEEYDPFFYSMLADSREVMLEILQDRTLNLGFREKLILELAEELQKKYDEYQLFDCEELLENYQNSVKSQETEISGEAVSYEMASKVFQAVERLERLKSDWEILLQETHNILFQSPEIYEQVQSRFADWLQHNLPQWNIWMEQLLVYFVYTYYCGAVYDGQIKTKIQMAVASRRTIADILAARWILNEESLDTEDAIDIAYRYSRELEHSDINLQKLEHMMKNLIKN